MAKKVSVSYGKILSVIALLALIGGSIAGSVFTLMSGPPDGPSKGYNPYIIAASMTGGAALVFLLNLIGLGFRSKYFGGLGILVASLIVAYGIYVLVTKDALIPIDHRLYPLVGGVATGAGAVALATSVGIATL